MRIIHTEGLKSLNGETLRLIEETQYINKNTQHTCTVVGQKDSEFSRHAKQSIPFIEFGFHEFDYHPLNFLKACFLLKKMMPDVIHTHNSKDAWVFGVAARILKIPIVRGRHITLPFKKSRAANFVYTHLADAFTVNCETIRKMILEADLGKPEQIFITPPGINFDKFNIKKIDRNFLKTELGLPSNSFLTGTACILRDWKGVDTLIQSFIEFIKKTQLPNIFLAIAGKGAEETRLRQLARDFSERIFFLGFREDIERVIGGMDLFVLASRKSEATSQTIPQAMALKVPVIGTNAGGIPDIIIDHKTGWLVEVDNIKEMAQRIEYVFHLSSDEKGKVTSNAYDFITREFTIEKTVSEYLKAYKMVTGS